MIRMVSIGEKIVLTLWVGGMWAIGYMAVPSLFYNLEDRQLAGMIAGQLFFLIYVVGFVSSILLLLSSLAQGVQLALRNWRVWLLVVALILISVGLFVLQPLMQELKALGLEEGSAQAAQFAKYHGISSLMYLITSLVGLVLVITRKD